METFREQELRARAHISPRALLKAALIAGLLVFFVPAGPWMSYESGIAVMGRVLTGSVFLSALWQVLFALLYGLGIAAVIYSMPTFMGIIVGAIMGIPLYALNYVILVQGMGVDSNEVHAGIAHLSFSLLFSSMYRAMAVPPPRDTPPLPSHRTR